MKASSKFVQEPDGFPFKSGNLVITKEDCATLKIVLVTDISEDIDCFKGVVVSGDSGVIPGQYSRNFIRSKFQQFRGKVELSTV